MQRQVPVERKSAVRLVSARVMLLRVTAVPVAATWAMLARMTVRVVKAARMTARAVKAPRVILTLTRAAPSRVPPGVPRSRVERPAQAKSPPSACRAGP